MLEVNDLTAREYHCCPGPDMENEQLKRLYFARVFENDALEVPRFSIARNSG